MKPFFAVLFLALSSPAVAQTSLDYAQMSRKIWSLFECTALASYTKNNAEAERLFSLGYETGKTFIGALKAGKIKSEDLRNYMPWTMSEKLSGPSADFALGRIYESIQEHTINEVWKDTVPGDDLRQIKALSTYEKQNCSFLK
jgi:hypothetical protein